MYRYVKASKPNWMVTEKDNLYPEYIYWDKYGNGKYICKYEQEYLHEGNHTTHNREEGMYYKIIEVNKTYGYDDDTNGFEPISWDDRYFMHGTSQLDVYADGFVGFVWDGHLNELGYLKGDQVKG